MAKTTTEVLSFLLRKEYYEQLSSFANTYNVNLDKDIDLEFCFDLLNYDDTEFNLFRSAVNEVVFEIERRLNGKFDLYANIDCKNNYKINIQIKGKE